MTYDIECVRCGLCVRECDHFAEAITLTEAKNFLSTAL